MKTNTRIRLISIILILISFNSCSKGSTSDDPPLSENEIAFTKSAQTLGETRTFGLDIGDIDLDGDEDIIIANVVGQSVLWLNNGNGTFSQSQTFNVSEAHDVKIADFNGDTYPDIFLLGMTSPSKIFFNNGNGDFTAGIQNIGSPNDNPNWAYPGDIDNDGDVDILIYNYENPNELWINDGDGTFSKNATDIGGINAKGFELADFNGDSFLDLFILMRGYPNQIWLNDGSGKFVNSGHSFGNGGDDTDFIDFDNDGDLDIAITNNGGVTIWLNQNNSGNFVSGHSIAEGTYYCKFVDVEMDGDFDLITTGISNGNKLWLNDGSGSFSSLGQIFGSNRVLCIGWEDFDGDGDFDIVFGQLEGTGGNSIYINESVIK